MTEHKFHTKAVRGTTLTSARCDCGWSTKEPVKSSEGLHMYWKHLDDLGLDKGGFLKPAPGEKAPKLSNDAGDHLVGIGILVVVLAIPAIIIWGVVRGLSGDSDDDAPGPQRVSDAQCEVWRIEGLGDGSTGTDPGDSLAKYEANNCG